MKKTWLIIGGVLAVLIVIGWIFGSSGEQGSSNRQASAEEIEKKRKGFHCLSEWDGNHDGFERLVKAQLKDPDSMETDTTKVTPVREDGTHAISMTFRARNSFGGMVVSEAIGTYDNETCDAVLVGIE